MALASVIGILIAVTIADSSAAHHHVTGSSRTSTLGTWRPLSPWRSFPERGRGARLRRQAPGARAVDRVLAFTPYIQVAGARRREIALTFDDGPNPPYTERILQILRRMHVPATFFVIGKWVRAYPSLVRAERRTGSDVGDHTQDHRALAALSPSAQAREINLAAAAIRAARAPDPVLMRPPYGSFNQTTLRITRAEHLLMVLWTVDTSDYARPGAARIISRAIAGARPGAIILMHDGGGDRSETVAALPRIIGALRRHGFRLVTVSQLVGDDPPARSHAPRRLAGRD